jgi:hypothetical protein
MNLTTNDKIVFQEIIRECCYEFCATATKIASNCDMTYAEVRRYMYGLVRKGLVQFGDGVIDDCESITGVYLLDGYGEPTDFEWGDYIEQDMISYYKGKGVL